MIRFSLTLLLCLSPAASLLQATYRGRFEHLKARACEGPPPVLTISCSVGAIIDVLSTSDATIVCEEDIGNASNTATCSNICSSEDECAKIWLETLITNTPTNGVFGNITFTCTGDSVGATFTYEDSGDGSCASGLSTRNYHVAQLGILCGDDTDFSFHANIFECTSGRGAVNARDRPFPKQLEGVYTCVAGDNCRHCDTKYDPLVIQTDEYRIPDECIVSLDGAAKPVLSAPASKPSPAGDYTATFQAQWATAYFSHFQCAEFWAPGPSTKPVINPQPYAIPIITMKCLNGRIKMVDTMFDTVECSAIGEDMLVCTEPTGEEFLSRLFPRYYSGMTYECSGQSLPETSVEMASLDFTCRKSTITGWVVPRLKLGVACNDPDADFRFYERYMECAEGNDFDMPMASFEDREREFDIYECSKIVDVPPNLDDVVTLESGPIGVFTSYRWSYLADSSCYSYTAA